MPFQTQWFFRGSLMLTEATPPWKNDLQNKTTKQERFSVWCLRRHITFYPHGFPYWWTQNHTPKTWWNFPISTQPCFFPKHPIYHKTTGFTALWMFVHPSFFPPSLFINRESHGSSAGKEKPGSARLALKGEISSGWVSNPANLRKLQRLLWHSIVLIGS